MEDLKVISATEMARIEKIAISQNEKATLTAELFMQKAGEGLAQKIIKLSSSKKVTFLLGKGNNAGDGLVCALSLLKKGYLVKILQLFDEENFSPLCLKNFKLLQKEPLSNPNLSIPKIKKIQEIEIFSDEIIVDAIFGTGLKGKIDDFIIKIIEKINSLENLKIAIDIPSGLDGDNGQINPIAIKANHTLFLELPKTGFFLNQGWNQVGELHKIFFGLNSKYRDLAKADFYLFEEKKAKELLPSIKRVRNKYEAGFVVGIAGSKGMEGAANLSGRAALRSGAGIVKLFMFDQDQNPPQEMTQELVKLNLDITKKEEVLATCNKAKALFIGPGIGRNEKVSKLLLFLLPQLKVPLVLDADGLYFLSNNLKDCPLPENTIITPHRKEMLRLLNLSEDIDDLSLISQTKQFSEKHKIIIILKGAPTFIFEENKIWISTAGDPGMATAGTGDVLTGIATALISEGSKASKAALLATHLHGKAGERTAKEKTSYSMIASDLIEQLPTVFKECLE